MGIMQVCRKRGVLPCISKILELPLRRPAKRGHRSENCTTSFPATMVLVLRRIPLNGYSPPKHLYTPLSPKIPCILAQEAKDSAHMLQRRLINAIQPQAMMTGGQVLLFLLSLFLLLQFVRTITIITKGAWEVLAEGYMTGGHSSGDPAVSMLL